MDVSGQLHAPITLTPVAIVWRLCGSHCRHGRGGQEENLYHSLETNCGLPARSQ